MNDQTLAGALARICGELLLTLRARTLLEGRALGKAGDSVSNALLVTTLAAQRPDDGVLSEEARDDPARLERQRVWVVDPLDGTREYSEGRDDWAVHVALCVDGAPAASAVAIPARDLLYAGDPTTGAPLEIAGDGHPGAHQPPRIAVSRTRPPAEAEHLVETLDAELVPLGSAGFKTHAVLSGEVDAYVHAGGQYEWDSAAPVGVALAAGLHCSRIDGSPLRYNRPDPRLDDLLICRAELAAALLAALADASGQLSGATG